MCSSELAFVELQHPRAEGLAAGGEASVEPARGVLGERRAACSARRACLPSACSVTDAGVGGLGGSLGGDGADADSAAVGGDDSDSVPAGGELVDSASGSALARHGLLQEDSSGGCGGEARSARRTWRGGRWAATKSWPRAEYVASTYYAAGFGPVSRTDPAPRCHRLRPLPGDRPWMASSRC